MMDPAGGMDNGDGLPEGEELKLQSQNQYLDNPIAQAAHLQGVWGEQ